MLDAIKAIRAASVRALWTDDDEAFPEDDTEPFACEVWLPVGRDREAAIGTFRERAASLGMQVSPGELRFPERSILVARTSLAAIQQSIATLNSIAELRRAKETADFFDSLEFEEQSAWMNHLLESLCDTQVEMRVTLSYFIEPNPSERGNSRYRYRSHGLRFDVKRPTETHSAFRARINAAVEPQGPNPATSDPHWLLGTDNRHRGSLHSDIWRGTAAELASRAQIAVFPTIGWWRTRDRLGCANRTARYALAISIRAPDTDVDLYVEVANQIAVSVEA